MIRLTRFVFLAALAAPLSACVGTTGSDMFTFDAAAAGPEGAIAGQPYTFTSGRGYEVSLTHATLRVGAVYLNRAVPVSGAQATNCILPGTYVAQVTEGLVVDLLSPDPQPFPVKGEATETPARVGEVWLMHEDVAIDEDNRDPILEVAGTATRDGQVFPFEGRITIGANRVPPIANPALPSAQPLCKERIVSPILLQFTPRAGGSLLLRIDPRGLFGNVDFAKLDPPTTGSTYEFADTSVPGPSANLYLGLQSRTGVYAFSWVEGKQP